MNNTDYAIRRIVAGHEDKGSAAIVRDGPAPNQKIEKLGNISTFIWSSDEAPAEVWANEDFGARENVICLSGKIDMALDDGEMVHMSAGDVMIQQANLHSWINSGSETCRIGFVLIGSKHKI